jgi:hypothetical protein
VADYPLATCIDDYRFGLLQGPLILVIGAAFSTATERGDEMFAVMARRCLAGLADHGILARGPGG